MTVGIDPDTSLAARSRAMQWSAFAILLVLLVATRAGLAYQIPQDHYRNSDELLVVQAATGYLLGLPPVYLSWPAGPLRVASGAVLLLDHLLAGRSIDPDGLIDHLSDTAHRPWRAMWQIRWLVMLTASLGIASLLPLFARHMRSWWAGIVVILLMATVAPLWIRTVMAMADGVAIAFVCLAFSAACRPRMTSSRVGLAGVLMGLALASKIVAVLALPFFVLLVLDSVDRRWRAVMTLMLFGSAGFILGCPWVLTSPIRLAKSMLGAAVVKTGTPMGLSFGLPAHMLKNLNELIPVWLLIVLLAALVVAVSRRRWLLLAGALLSFGLAGVLTLRNVSSDPRYTMALIPVTVTFSVLMLGRPLVDWLASQAASRARLVRASLLGLAAILVGSHVMAARHADASSESYFRGVNDAAVALRAEPGVRSLATGRGPLVLLADLFSTATLSEEASRLERRLIDGESSVEMLQSQFGIAEATARRFAAHFNEIDRNLVAQLRLMADGGPVDGIDLTLVSEGGEAGRFGGPTREEAFTMLSQGSIDAALLRTQEDEPPGGRRHGGIEGHRYTLYLRRDLHDDQ